ncbi:hypothetical protein EYW49_20065 [Siculibacillus lacustris]|uniref:Uncharacterized protein n=1 Tax=Siculibacillus lacustris TaxID=1549641 RepID=A0A4Q9VFC0_9HYPH|nr:hypothetical protein [Siculibacillus lacustris]TBW33579.1 hypothetical protein EYW49_20065 [Siculibacillus lacustris]
MTDIPEDVMRAARAVAKGMFDPIDVEEIARAILAERERCAKIAEGWEATMRRGQYIDDALKSVAAAIRAPREEG